MGDLLETLNPPQREAVLHGDGPLLVLAGAGSGKTRVLTHRIAHLIAERGVPPWAILAITFTNKAAGEMRERIAGLVGPAAREIWASTFHSACVRILRRDAEAAGFDPRFVIYDADDQLRLMRACMTDEQVDPKRVAPRAVLTRISDAKNRLLDPDGFADEAASFGDEIVVRLYRRYADRLRTAGAMDFDDLLMHTVRLLEGDAEVRERYQRRFSHVLVDEYQDTNHAQYRLVRVLAEPQRNVCAVGDDDQGIYSWRGADVRNILDFERDYPDAHIVALEQNYRSTGTILRAANAVVALNRGRRPKELWTDRGDGEPIRIDSCRDEHEEARLVVSEVDRALAEGTSLSEIAVFYRTNAQSRAIEDQLVRARVAYAVVGGPRFYERAEVRDLIAYLRVVANPADEIAMARMLGAPRRGIGPGCIAKLTRFARDHDLAPAEAIPQAEMVPGLTGAQRQALAATAATLAELGQYAAAGLALDRIIDAAIERSGLRSALVAEGTLEAQGRLENLDELVNVAAEYQGQADDPSLAGFLEEIALQSDADLVDQGTGQVTLMTVHNAKGLEFDVVLMTGMEEGVFPHMRSDTPESLEEERRLCYVGMTRARRRLILTHAETRAMHGGRDYKLPSRFLSEIPRDAVARPAGAPVRRAYADSAPRGSSLAGRSTAPPAPPVILATGDTVLHATFGEGVVTGVESRGQLVRVRFANDGTERRLMAGAAPMRKVV
ncbi:MAG: UvrD-helicase domain-containing protein [Thermoleophilia bacterium]|nr:UvrD-helicase domain-containing protein [Thermoleophilia bacterium]